MILITQIKNKIIYAFVKKIIVTYMQKQISQSGGYYNQKYHESLYTISGKQSHVNLGKSQKKVNLLVPGLTHTPSTLVATF